ncbi:sugar isomerase, partial [bacterium]|nr:sugar isomerase [bacterium]
LKGKTLRVQPILQYKVAEPREMSSWRSWGGVLDDESANEEAQRIQQELNQLQEKATFPFEVLPVVKIKTENQARKTLNQSFDLAIVYPASGSGTLLQACVPKDRDALIFVRHRSGPTYYWYEALSVAYLQTDQPGRETRLGKTHVDDVVVDDCDELLWRLRSCYAIHNLKNTRIAAVGGPWGKYAADAPKIAKDKYGIEIVDVGYDQIEPRINSLLNDAAQVELATKRTEQYLQLPHTILKTDKQFVVNAFLLYELFKEIMNESDASAFTIKECMSTIIPMSKTTACLTLGLLNDEGAIAFCESDFVVIPAGILMRHIVDAPVFLHNSTFPHQGTVTCAHCSAPRRMNGDRYEPTTILTHEESDYGAAPKVEIPVGQELSFINPEYTT